MFSVRKWTLKMMISLQLILVLSKNNLRYLNFSEPSDFCWVNRSQDVFFTLHLMAIVQGDPLSKSWKAAPEIHHLYLSKERSCFITVCLILIRSSGNISVTHKTLSIPYHRVDWRKWPWLEYILIKSMVFVIDTGRDSSVNASRLARDFTDDSIHTMPTHVTKIVTMSNSMSREELLEEEPATA